MTELDESLRLQPTGEGEWKAYADPRREAQSGMYGGWTAALLLRSVVDDPRAVGTPSALTVHYFKAITPKSDLLVRTRLIKGGRSLAFWRAEVLLNGGASAEATIVLAQRAASDRFTQPSMPDAPDPDTLPETHPPNTFGERSLCRPIVGFPIFNRMDSESYFWVRELSRRPVDYVQLAYLSDHYGPRVFCISPGPRPYSTVTLSTYFHATAAELSEIGDDYVLMDVSGTRFESSTSGSRAKLWSRKGTLLATSEQLGWFR